MNTDATLLKIAQDHFRVETLATRRMDSLDFHDTAVWSMKAALEAAFAAGAASAKAARKAAATARKGG